MIDSDARPQPGDGGCVEPAAGLWVETRDDYQLPKLMKHIPPNQKTDKSNLKMAIIQIPIEMYKF